MVYIWLAVFTVCLLFEALNAGTLVSIWFSAGAVIPLIMSFWGVTNPICITAEILIFGIVTTLCLVFIRKIAKRWLLMNDNEKTNLDLYVGNKYEVTNSYGNVAYIKINGIEYSVALEEKNKDLKVGDKVEIVKFEGNKAIVKKA
jgi:membrane protein implicated in regulation of membrane protease activity